LKIPNLTPFNVEKLDVQASESLTIKFEDIVFYGIEKAVLKDIDLDTDKKEWTFMGNFPKVELIGKYDMKGKILILPIAGNGATNLTIDNLLVTYKCMYELVNKKGEEYANCKDSSVDFTMDRMYFKFDNLFNGDPRLGPEMNVFLNENWKEVSQEVTPGISAVMKAIVNSVLGRYMAKIPFKNFTNLKN